jgi:hypothetical protein
MRWSVSLMTEGDRVIELDEVVELADAVATNGGIATGMGTQGYGAQLVVEAEDSGRAVELAMAVFSEAVAKAGLPVWPIVEAETIAEDEELFYEMGEEGPDG